MTDRPFWFPDAKGWAAIAYFCLSASILAMIREDHTLLANSAFMGLSGQIIGVGGIGLILAYYFGSSSGAKSANDRADKAIAAMENKQ